MKLKWNRTIGALALSAMALGAIAPPVFAVETGQMLDKGPRWPNNKITRTIGSAECPGPACTPEVIKEAEQRGQITPKEAKALRKIQSNPPSVDKGKSATIDPPTTENNQLCGLPHTPPCRADAPSTDVETGQKLDKGRPPTGSSARVKAKANPRSAGSGTSSWVLPVAGALAVGAGVLAVTSGDNNPASPN